MDSSTPSEDTSQPSSTVPSISIAISNTRDIFDLSIPTPFTINLVLILHHNQSITFAKRDAPLFASPLCNPGVTFTNIHTGEKIVGSRINVCYIGLSEDDCLPKEANKKSWITLHPDHPYALTAAVEPMLAPLRMRTLAEMETMKQPEGMKWPGVSGFLDGEVFEIGVSDGAGPKEWLVGSLESILKGKEKGVVPKFEKGAGGIGMEVRQMARFRIKRPDEDGSLNWP